MHRLTRFYWIRFRLKINQLKKINTLDFFFYVSKKIPTVSRSYN